MPLHRIGATNPPMMKYLLILCTLVFCLGPYAAQADTTAIVKHDLIVRVFTEEGHVHVQDDIIVPAGPPVHFLFSLNIDNLKMTPLSGKPHWIQSAYERTLSPGSSPVQIRLEYDFDILQGADIVPQGIDNPGMYANAYIQPQAAFLPPSRGWHPLAEEYDNDFTLQIDTPAPLIAVSAGIFQGVTTRNTRHITVWHAKRHNAPMALVVGPFQSERGETKPVPVQTFFLDDNASLAPIYLRAAEQHLTFYNTLFGPYAFGQFGIVENALPTGYGFPSFTLLGSAVLRLPFIPYTSLRHEIAHSWWGNGVLVDVRGGNWCEGLTTYVADYLAKEEQSAEAAKEYRQTVLRDFTELAADLDLPLSRFVSRTSPASHALGYGKAMFVFHMLRQRVGHDAFYSTLAQLYKKRLHLPTTWRDINAAFVESGTITRDESQQFFGQWIHRSGGPCLQITDPHVTQTDSKWLVTATMKQAGEVYSLQLPYVLTTETERIEGVLDVHSPSTQLEVTSNDAPQTLEIDPEANVFRVLSKDEIGTSINSLKAAHRLVVIVSDQFPIENSTIVADLATGLGHEHARIIHERDLSPTDINNAALLYIGVPKATQPALSDTSVAAAQAALTDDKNDAVFIVESIPAIHKEPVAFLAISSTISAHDFVAVVRKIPHYGKYNQLHFLHGNNTLKLFSSPESTLRVTFPTSPKQIMKQSNTNNS